MYSLISTPLSTTIIMLLISLSFLTLQLGAHTHDMQGHVTPPPPSTCSSPASATTRYCFKSHAPIPHPSHCYKYPSNPQNSTVRNATFVCRLRVIKEMETTAQQPQQEEEEEQEAVDDRIDFDKLRFEFLQVLRSRRSPEVPLRVEKAEPVKDPLFQEASPPKFSEAMASAPKADIGNLTELLKEENLYLFTEEAEQGRVPVLILSLKEWKQRRPAIVFLHSTNKNKEWLRPLLEAYASRGYVAIAIDSRYHGERASSKTTYRDALVSAWKTGETMPFIYDTVWDLIKLADYLTEREDIDPCRIGITGESLGGMHAWFAAFTDTRYVVVAPIIGIQGFHWAIENDKWQARVDSIRPVFEEAQKDLCKSAIDKEVAKKVWGRIAPGLASRFDSPYTVPAIAPRPLLILNGAEDPRCPLPGLEIPKSRACKAYAEACSKNNIDAHPAKLFKLIAEPGIPHQMTSFMVKEASDWFDKYLKQC